MAAPIHLNKATNDSFTCLGQDQAGQGPQRGEAGLAIDEEDKRERDQVEADEEPLRCMRGCLREGDLVWLIRTYLHTQHIGVRSDSIVNSPHTPPTPTKAEERSAGQLTQPDIPPLVRQVIEGGEEPDETSRVDEGAGVACVGSVRVEGRVVCECQPIHTHTHIYTYTYIYICTCIHTYIITHPGASSSPSPPPPKSLPPPACTPPSRSPYLCVYVLRCGDPNQSTQIPMLFLRKQPPRPSMDRFGSDSTTPPSSPRATLARGVALTGHAFHDEDGEQGVPNHQKPGEDSPPRRLVRGVEGGGFAGGCES